MAIAWLVTRWINTKKFVKNALHPIDWTKVLITAFENGKNKKTLYVMNQIWYNKHEWKNFFDKFNKLTTNNW